MAQHKTRITAVALSTLACLCHASSPPVTIGLRSSWAAPPFLLEVIETVALENPSSFFPLIDALTVLPQTTLSAEAIGQNALQVAVDKGLLTEPGALSSVEMSLALHAATPKLQAFYYYYSDHYGGESKCAGSWVDWYGQVVCDVESLAKLSGVGTIDDHKKHATFTRPAILPFDHIYPSPAESLTPPPRTAILYASITSSNFRELHEYLLSAAPKVEYIFRHVPPANTSDRNYLSGYGVSLDLKKTDYLAVDDRNSHNNGNHLQQQDDGTVVEDPILALIEAHPANTSAAPAKDQFTPEELELLSLQATQLIYDSGKNALQTLKGLTQNFPRYAKTISRHSVLVDPKLEEEIDTNHRMAQRGVDVFWLNGQVVKEEKVTAFGLLSLLKKERNVVNSLTGLGLARGESIQLITHPLIAAGNKASAVIDGLFDASDRIEGGGAITWWNDIETDGRYATWSPSLTGLLNPLYPGQFPTVRRNIFNIVLIADLSSLESLQFLVGPVSSIIQRSFPFRFGVVPLASTGGDDAKMAKLFLHLVKTYGRKQTMDFIRKIARPSIESPTRISWSLVRTEFDNLANSDAEVEDAESDFDVIISGTEGLDKAQAYAARLGSTGAEKGGHAFINGKHFDLDSSFLRYLQTEVGTLSNYLQELIYSGAITDDDGDSISTYFYDLPSTSTRRNPFVYPASAAGSLRVYNLPELFARTGYGYAGEAAGFLYPAESENIPLTIFVVADLDSEAGLNFVRETTIYIEKTTRARVSFIHKALAATADKDQTSSRKIAHLLTSKSLSKLSPGALWETIQSKDAPTIEEKVYQEYIRKCELVVRALRLEGEGLALLVNGRIVGPFSDGDFVAADLDSLEQYESRKRAEPVRDALKEINPDLLDRDRATVANLISMASSVVASMQLPDPSEVGLFEAPQRPRTRNYQMLAGNYTMFEFGDNSTALYHIGVLIDPLSDVAPKWASILEWLTSIPEVHVELRLNPTEHTEMPLKRFYRYNVLPTLAFDIDGAEIPAHAVFKDLPTEPIYTLAMDVPSSWLVRPRESLYDLDNIQLGHLAAEDIHRGVEAIFELDYFVIEGHARDEQSAPPRGVQLQLTNSNPNNTVPLDDTQVVANLGYFQFKAKPGVFHLEIREGRGREVFEMVSVGDEGWESRNVSTVGDGIAVTSFEGRTIYPRVQRLAGMEAEDVLLERRNADVPSGVLDTLSSKVFSFFGKKDEPVQTKEVGEAQAEINIFTVASGLLYERFVGIMILSVLRNTNSTVKFWFIENFLSPSFLEFIPHLAKAYNFKYELVTYKWPSWLRAQKEKQRIIWAYKILFLDVLFPMDLKKVIFVDADQIVRADLKELVDLDLQGAPYGYTPMGDDNYDMEGFRFWKTGYWKDFLQGRPYHISALYVVDLVRFRQMAAGDILRGQYQQLSADPNSLSNLDQDLPNNLQREVPIFSLPEDWLWCETWCSKDRLDRAKTIDLCQNPLTKEPKLDRARQIPEWEEYDSEIAAFEKKLASDGLVHSRFAAVDVGVLAGGGGAKAGETAEVDKEAEAEFVRDEL